MNWGVKIIIFLGAFMIFIIGSVVYMLSADSDELEEKDYYEQALNYDERYDKNKNTLRDNAEPDIQIEGKELVLTFPTLVKEGKLELRRASNKVKDQEIILRENEDTYIIDVSDLVKGSWKCIVEWSGADAAYRFEKNIYL